MEMPDHYILFTIPRVLFNETKTRFQVPKSPPLAPGVLADVSEI